MIEIEGKLERNITIDEDTILKGMIVGDVVVLGSAEFVLRGMMEGNLSIRENTTVYLNGTVNGDVINNGGSLEVYETINGRLFRERGNTFIDGNAVVQDK